MHLLHFMQLEMTVKHKFVDTLWVYILEMGILNHAH